MNSINFNLDWFWNVIISWNRDHFFFFDAFFLPKLSKGFTKSMEPGAGNCRLAAGKPSNRERDYVKVLREHLIPFFAKFFRTDWISDIYSSRSESSEIRLYIDVKGRNFRYDFPPTPPLLLFYPVDWPTKPYSCLRWCNYKLCSLRRWISSSSTSS